MNNCIFIKNICITTKCTYMKLPQLLSMFIFSILIMLHEGIKAQSSQTQNSPGINLTKRSAYTSTVSAGDAKGIVFGTSSKGSSGGGSAGFAMPGGKTHNRVPKDCIPGQGLCKAGSLTRASVSNNRIPTQSVLFIIDSVNNANLAMLIHLDSPSCSQITQTLRSYRYSYSNYNAGDINFLQAVYPGTVNVFELPSTMSFTLDSPSCQKIGITTDASGLYIPANTLCLIDTFASDTNFYKITFAGSIANKFSYKLGNPRSNCDNSALGICDFATWGSNSDYGFYITTDGGTDSTLSFSFFMNYNNIINAQPDMKSVFENYFGFPGGTSIFTINNNLGNYSGFSAWSSYTINSYYQTRGTGTLVSPNWMIYQFQASPINDLSDGFIRRSNAKPEKK